MKLYLKIMCAPRKARPGVYALKVFNHLKIEYVEPTRKMLGTWEWDIVVADDFDYNSFDKWMSKEMKELCDDGCILFAKWAQYATVY